MNLDSLISSSAIRSETLTASLNRHNYPSAHQTMPQRSPFAIQELLGLSDSSRQPSNGNSSSNNQNGSSLGSVSSVAPSIYSQTNPVDHHQMQMASRMAYFNAHAAAFNVAAAFLPHNMSSGGAGHLGLHPQSAGKLRSTRNSTKRKSNDAVPMSHKFPSFLFHCVLQQKSVRKVQGSRNIVFQPLKMHNISGTRQPCRQEISFQYSLAV